MPAAQGLPWAQVSGRRLLSREIAGPSSWKHGNAELRANAQAAMFGQACVRFALRTRECRREGCEVRCCGGEAKLRVMVRSMVVRSLSRRQGDTLTWIRASTSFSYLTSANVSEVQSNREQRGCREAEAVSAQDLELFRKSATALH